MKHSNEVVLSEFKTTLLNKHILETKFDILIYFVSLSYRPELKKYINMTNKEKINFFNKKCNCDYMLELNKSSQILEKFIKSLKLLIGLPYEKLISAINEKISKYFDIPINEKEKNILYEIYHR
jgi:hypothetical protein